MIRSYSIPLSKSFFKKAILALSLTAGVYLLMILPIFFMYPNYNTAIKRNISMEYFYELTDTSGGDCYRVAQNFMKDCPFPTREVHLSSEHTIVEILINERWYAYDPLKMRFFSNHNVLKVSLDVSRGYIPDYMEDYEYANSFKEVKYYHSFYFVFLKYICPFYDKIMKLYYMID